MYNAISSQPQIKRDDLSSTKNLSSPKIKTTKNQPAKVTENLNYFPAPSDKLKKSSEPMPIEWKNTTSEQKKYLQFVYKFNHAQNTELDEDLSFSFKSHSSVTSDFSFTSVSSGLSLDAENEIFECEDYK